MAQYAYQKYAALAGGDSTAQSAYWEIFAIQRDRKDFDGALTTLEQIRQGAKGDSDTPLEALYREGEIYSGMGKPDEALAAWEKLKGLKPVNNAFRLQALIKLGEAYEKSDAERAAQEYDDLSQSTSGDVSRSAAQRAAALRRMAKENPQKAAPAPQPQQQTQQEPAPQEQPQPAQSAAQSAAPAPAPAPAAKQPNAPAKKDAGVPSGDEMQ